MSVFRVELSISEIIEAENVIVDRLPIVQNSVIVFEGEKSVADIEFQRVSNLLKG